MSVKAQQQDVIANQSENTKVRKKQNEKQNEYKKTNSNNTNNPNANSEGLLMEQTEAMRKKNLTIYDLLRQDNEDVKKLFKQIIDPQRYQDSVYSQIKKALTVHMVGEEKLLYPKLENKNETRQLVLESYEAHEVEKKMIDYVDMTSSTDSESRFAIVKMLSEAIDESIKEEEGDLFKKAKRVLSDNEANEIGRLFKKEKMSSM